MKKILLIVLMSFIAFGIYSFKNPINDDAKELNGIKFFNGTFKEALLEAKKLKKPIFLDVYATWCGPCKKLKRTSFKNEEVGNYFNTNFVNLAIDGETKEGRELMRVYNIRSYPSLLILDDQGNIKARTTGYKNPYILINFGKRIQP